MSHIELLFGNGELGVGKVFLDSGLPMIFVYPLEHGQEIGQDVNHVPDVIEASVKMIFRNKESIEVLERALTWAKERL